MAYSKVGNHICQSYFLTSVTTVLRISKKTQKTRQYHTELSGAIFVKAVKYINETLQIQVQYKAQR